MGTTPPRVDRSPRFRAAWTLLFLALFGAVLVASALSTIAEIGLLERIADGEPVSNSEVTANDNRQRAVSSLYFMSFLATVVAFCLWIYRASANLGAMGVEGQRFSPRWAVHLVVRPRDAALPAVPGGQ